MLESTNKTKISAQIWPMALRAINRDLRLLHIKRDSYLNALLTREIENLEQEVDFRTPDPAPAKIKRRLQELKPEPMTVVIDRSLQTRIDQVLKDRNISRNAFLNRVLVFLCAKPPLLDRLGISYNKTAETQVKPLDEAWSNLQDPFENIRASNHFKFYGLVIPEDPPALNYPSLFGLNCAISDYNWDVLNTPPEELLADLMGLDAVQAP